MVTADPAIGTSASSGCPTVCDERSRNVGFHALTVFEIFPALYRLVVSAPARCISVDIGSQVLDA
jgi:hypothetical protein